jgi:LmbE family N-acetylglucosaminyl deacetylase
MAAVTDLDPAAATDRAIVGMGTPAEQWQTWSGWTHLPNRDIDDLAPPHHRLVVIAPHPDDEVLGCGGLLSVAVRAAREISIVAVTDGDASHPGSTRWPAPELIEERCRERAEALAVLGVSADAVLRLGFADGQVSTHQAELARRLATLIDDRDVIVTPWRFDGHPDHEAVAHAVAGVVRERGARHLEAPIWGWHWTKPEDRLMPWSRAAVFPLDANAFQAKSAAAQRFTSQIEPDPSTGADPVLAGWTLARLIQPREVYFQ